MSSDQDWVALRRGDIKANQLVEWCVFNRRGELILQPGQVLESQRVIDLMIDRSLYRSSETQSWAVPDKSELPGYEYYELSGDEDPPVESDNKNSFERGDCQKAVRSLEDIESLSFKAEAPEFMQGLYRELREETKSYLCQMLKDHFLPELKKEIEHHLHVNVLPDLGRQIKQSLEIQLSRQIEAQVDLGLKNINRKDPFSLINKFRHRLENIFAGIDEGRQESVRHVLRLAADIQALCDSDPDAVLASLHIGCEGKYMVAHPINMAAACELIARRAGYSTEHRQIILAAALTCNLGMRELQQQLQMQKESLSKEQRQQLHLHPQKSCEMLKFIGVNNKLWLDIVYQHHERLDGSGYPLGLTEDDIIKEARILSISDRYSSMVTDRAYRTAVMGKEGLSQLLSDNGSQYDESLTLLTINEFSIFPPGTFVKLQNSETAIVIKRSNHGNMYPIVSSFIGADGKYYKSPIMRDTKSGMYRIKSACSYRRARPLDYAKLWGY